MTVEALERAFELARAGGLFMDEPLPVDAAEIRKLGDAFGVDLPHSYAEFLNKYGTVAVDGIEFYGLVPGRLDVPSIPNTLWFTRMLQNQSSLPDGLLVVEDLGGGAYACLNLQQMNNKESPVVLWETAFTQKPVRELERLASSFGEYVEIRVQSLLL